MKIGDFISNSLNIEINNFRIDDVAEKVGFLLFGETGRVIGRMIDNATKDKDIKIGSKKDED